MNTPLTSKTAVQSNVGAFPGELVIDIAAKKPTKAEVVANVEARLAMHIIGPGHNEWCRCSFCWVRFQASWAAEQTNIDETQTVQYV